MNVATRVPHRPPLRSASGKGTIRTILTLALVGAVAYAGFKLIPVRAAAYQFDDEVREQIVLAGSRRRRVGDEEIRRTLLERAGDLGLDVTARDVKIRRSANTIRIEVQYSVPVEFPYYAFSWDFTSRHEGPVF